MYKITIVPPPVSRCRKQVRQILPIANVSLSSPVPQQPTTSVAGLEIACISIVSSFVATIFTAPLNALKLHAIDKNVNCLITLLRAMDSINLYRGYWTAVLKFAPRHAIEHCTYDILKGALSHGVAGAISQSLSVIMVHPLDNIHMRNVLRRSPMCIASMFKGVVPALAQSALSGMLWYSTMNVAKSFTDNGFALCGACALVCNTVLHPLDVVKTTCSTRSVDAVVAAQHIWSTRRWLAGIGMVSLTSIPSQTIAYGTYVTFRQLFERCKTTET